jgi:hypothetical protein
MTTRVSTLYNGRNFALLVVGVGLALGGAWLAVMTMAFGADPVHDARSAVVVAALWASLALIPASLISFRWPNVSAILSWSISALCGLCAWASPVLLLFLIFALVEGFIASSVASRSKASLA